MITTINAVVNTKMPPSCHSVTARDQPFHQMQNKGLAVFWIIVTGTAGASTYTEWQPSALVVTTLWLAKTWTWPKFLRHFLPWIAFFKTSNFKSTRVQISLISEGKNGFILMHDRRGMPGERRGLENGSDERGRWDGSGTGWDIRVTLEEIRWEVPNKASLLLRYPQKMDLSLPFPRAPLTQRAPHCLAHRRQVSLVILPA